MHRCAILLDELDCVVEMPKTAPFLTAMAAASTSDGGDLPSQLDLSLLGGHVVVELKTANAMPLLKYACSSRVMALPTNQLNAQRVRIQGPCDKQRGRSEPDVDSVAPSP